MTDRESTTDGVETVHQRFKREFAAFVAAKGYPPTRCRLSFDVGREAAREHDSSSGPMFQYWHPTMLFEVVDGHNVLELSAD